MALKKTPRIRTATAGGAGGGVGGGDEEAKERIKELEAKIAALEGKLEGSEYQRNQLKDDLDLCREDLESAQEKVWFFAFLCRGQTFTRLAGERAG